MVRRRAVLKWWLAALNESWSLLQNVMKKVRLSLSLSLRSTTFKQAPEWKGTVWVQFERKAFLLGCASHLLLISKRAVLTIMMFSQSYNSLNYQ